MTPVERLLAKLPDAKQTGKGWSARARPTKTGGQAFAFREGDNGRRAAALSRGLRTGGGGLRHRADVLPT